MFFDALFRCRQELVILALIYSTFLCNVIGSFHFPLGDHAALHYRTFKTIAYKWAFEIGDGKIVDLRADRLGRIGGIERPDGERSNFFLRSLAA